MKILKFFLIIIMIGLGILGYSYIIEPSLLVTEEVILKSDVVEDGTKVAVITDIHLKESFTEEHLQKIVNKVNALDSDAVLFLGDLYDNYELWQGDKERISGILSQLSAETKLCVYGNHDYGGRAQWVYKEIMEGAGFTILKNERYDTDMGITFYGCDDYIFGEHSEIYSFDNENYAFVLAHAPASAALVEGFDFLIAGHTHGGQVKLPFIEPFWLPVGSGGYCRGQYQSEDGQSVYVSRGIGTSVINMRFNSVPEITICKFSKKTVEK